MNKMTDEEIKEYADLVEFHGLARQRNFGEKDAIAFAMGAACIFYYLQQQGQIPASWIMLPMMGRSPFIERADTPGDIAKVIQDAKDERGKR